MTKIIGENWRGEYLFLGLFSPTSLFIHFSGFSCRGDRGWCGKHGVLPWRAWQCEHGQHQRLGRPQQPAEHGQWRGLLLLQCQACLLLLEHHTTMTTAPPAKSASPPICLSTEPCHHLPPRARPPANGVPDAPPHSESFIFCPFLLSMRLNPLWCELPIASDLWDTNTGTRDPGHSYARLPVLLKPILKGDQRLYKYPSWFFFFNNNKKLWFYYYFFDSFKCLNS